MTGLFSRMEVGDQVIIVHKNKSGKVLKVYDSAHKPFSKRALAFMKFIFTGQRTYNSMTNAGFGVTSGLVNGAGGTAFTYTAIGTGTVAAAATDTQLGTETKRKVGTQSQVTTSVTNDTSQWDATFSSGDGLSGTAAVTEVGVLNASSSGTLLLRQVFSAINVNWTNGDTLEMIVKCKCQQGT